MSWLTRLSHLRLTSAPTEKTARKKLHATLKELSERLHESPARCLPQFFGPLEIDLTLLGSPVRPDAALLQRLEKALWELPENVYFTGHKNLTLGNMTEESPQEYREIRDQIQSLSAKAREQLEAAKRELSDMPAPPARN